VRPGGARLRNAVTSSLTTRRAGSPTDEQWSHLAQPEKGHRTRLDCMAKFLPPAKRLRSHALRISGRLERHSALTPTCGSLLYKLDQPTADPSTLLFSAHLDVHQFQVHPTLLNGVAARSFGDDDLLLVHELGSRQTAESLPTLVKVLSENGLPNPTSPQRIIGARAR